MAGIEESNPYRQALIGLINAINREVPLEEKNQVLLVILLDTEHKIYTFGHWIKEHLNGMGKLQATEIEIVRAAVHINKGLI